MDTKRSASYSSFNVDSTMEEEDRLHVGEIGRIGPRIRKTASFLEETAQFSTRGACACLSISFLFATICFTFTSFSAHEVPPPTPLGPVGGTPESSSPELRDTSGGATPHHTLRGPPWITPDGSTSDAFPTPAYYALPQRSTRPYQKNPTHHLFSFAEQKFLAESNSTFFAASHLPLAQKTFLLGLQFYYSTWYDLAVQKFQQTQELDPNFLMAYWGELMCYKGTLTKSANFSAGQSVVDKVEAANLVSRASPKERAYYNTIASFFKLPQSGYSSRNQLARASENYVHAMEKIAKKYNDSESIVLYGLAKLDYAICAADVLTESESEYLFEQTQSIFESVLQNEPHSGALHSIFYTHQLGNTGSIQATLPVAYYFLSRPKYALPSSHGLLLSSKVFGQANLWPEAVATANRALTSLDALLPALSKDSSARQAYLDWIDYCKSKLDTQA